MREERKAIWIDKFQTTLSIRIGGYLVVFLVVLCNFLFAWKMLDEGPVQPLEQFFSMLREYLPVFVCLIVLVPVIAWDAICFSHRLVGPVVRFRKTIQAIAAGEPVRPIKLRDGDYLTEMRDEFNTMLEELQRQGVPVIKPVASAPEDGAPKKTA